MYAMPKAASETESFGSLRELAQDCHRDLEGVRREATEMTVLIKQISSEVERQTTRAAESASKLREAEMAPDAYTRAEVRELNANAQESEMRLFMMKEQLAQLEFKTENLRRYQKLLERVVDVSRRLLEGVGEIPAAAAAPVAATVPANEVTASTITQFTVATAADKDVSRIVEVQEDERQRIARQIHDGPAQSLVNLILRAEVCERLQTADPEALKPELASLKDTVVDTLRVTRQFIFDLRPMILDDLGLVPTLRRYIESLATKKGTLVNVSSSGAESRLPGRLEIALFRIAQEAIDNALTHGQAGEVQVNVVVLDGLVRLAIDDNGVGFNVDKALAANASRGLRGIKGMLERAQAVGGKVSLDSAAGRGTRVRVEIPL
ncbi:MAG: sensor histidine kinase [Chloroflexi bacterium]|nr:sensor histidine kinase [Chloroflexota bacterium]